MTSVPEDLTGLEVYVREAQRLYADYIELRRQESEGTSEAYEALITFVAKQLRDMRGASEEQKIDAMFLVDKGVDRSRQLFSAGYTRFLNDLILALSEKAGWNYSGVVLSPELVLS